MQWINGKSHAFFRTKYAKTEIVHLTYITPTLLEGMEGNLDNIPRHLLYIFEVETVALVSLSSHPTKEVTH